MTEVTVGMIHSIGYMGHQRIGRSRTSVTAGELINHLRRLNPRQQVFYQGHDGELVPIIYAELREWK